MMEKDQLVLGAMSCIDALEFLLIVFTVSFLAVIELNTSQFCKCLSTSLNTTQRNNENCV